MTELEKRGGDLGVEVRADDDGKKTLKGYAAVFNREAVIGDYFIESIAPGAFTKTIGGDILALVNHDSGRVIGRTKSGTLRLKEDDVGLKVEIDVPDTADGRDLWTLVERGDVTGMSFGFRVTKQDWDETGDIPRRLIREVELFEVTATAIPAYPDATLAVRSLEAAREDRATLNARAAQRRIAGRKAAFEQKIRGIPQDAS